MLCSNCGYEVELDDEYCGNCGFPVRPESSQEVSSKGSEQLPPTSIPELGFRLPPAVGSWRTLKWLVAGAALILFSCGVVCSSLVFSRAVKIEPVGYAMVVTATSTLAPTNTPGPSPTPTVTHTPTATRTPTPSPTLRPTTIPGSTLPPDQPWLEGNLELEFHVVALQPEALVIDLVLYNRGDETILFEVQPDMFRLISNLGDIISPSRNSYGHFSPFAGFTGGSLSLELGERIDLAKNAPFSYNLANPSLTELTMEVAGLSQIKRARWHIPIPH